jgi:hypothetical protein
MKKLPIGISDFKELIDGGYYYVDKTALIKEVLESGKVVFMPRPRRFGKTLNLSMIRYFLEKGSENTSYLFKDTQIWEFKEYREFQGSSPVIFITFKDVKEETWDNAYARLAYVLAQLFDAFEYLLESDTIKEREKELFQKIADRRASEVELKASLHFLAKLLHKHFGKKPYLLIDEYDVPIQEAYIRGYYDKAISFFEGLLGTVLKDNNEMEKGIVTGIMTLTKAGIFSGLNNLDVFDLTSINLADRFGFTKEEVKALLEYYGYSKQEDDIKRWYDGYTFGRTPEIYNPWSVLNCIRNEGICQNYWVSTSGNLLVKKLIARSSIEVKSKLEKLIVGQTISETIDKSIVFPELESRVDALWSLLLFTGYLSYSDYTIKVGKVYAALRIPNEELSYLFTELISEIFKESILGGRVSDLLQALANGDSETFSDLLQSFVYNSMSSYDLSSKEPEKSYHLFVLGLLVALRDIYEVKSNKESGAGRYDIMLIPRIANKPGIVIEFKVVRSGETLESTAKRALEQITQKKYTEELFDRDITTIRAYGIAFEGKNLFVESSEIDHTL